VVNLLLLPVSVLTIVISLPNFIQLRSPQWSYDVISFLKMAVMASQIYF